MAKAIITVFALALATSVSGFGNTGIMTAPEAYELCKVEACYEAIDSTGTCCNGGWCDASEEVCYTDDGLKYAYSEEFNRKRQLRGDRKLFDNCDDTLFVNCMASYTGISFED